MNIEQNTDVWNRLLDGRSLDGLGLGLRDGRLDLRNLVAPEPEVIRRFKTKIADVAMLSGVTKLQGATWESLDFAGSRLKGLLFSDSRISNCIFDECQCRDWGLWATTVSNTSFRSADLRSSGLGGLRDVRMNTYQNLDFTGADLRQTTFSAAEFINCQFKNTRLDGVDFNGSIFVDCTFEGELNEVIFNRKGFKLDALPTNEMLRVDFTRAQLRWVEFRGLDLNTVLFPADSDHIVVNNYPQTLDRLLQVFQGRTDRESRKLAVSFGVKRKWIGRNQQRGVLNKKDLLESGGEEGLRMVLGIIESGRL